MDNGPEIILVAVDGSDGSAAAVRYARALAEPLQIPIRLLFAFPQDALDLLGVPAETMEDRDMEAYSPARFAQLREKRAGQVFARARDALGDTRIPFEEVVLMGDPAEAILDYAQGTEQPLIVMGSRGLSRFSEMLVGSVSHRVLHHAKCPVTIVPG